MSPCTVLAQRRGGHGTSAGRPSAGGSNTDDLKDFKRAVALQASPDQMKQFNKLTKSTQAARQGAHDLVQLAGNTSRPDLFRNTSPLTSALQEAEADNEKFVQSFSEAQKSGLKDATKKLKKSHSELTKQSKALTRGLERPGTDGKQIVNVAEKLDRALGDLQTRQLAIGHQMGIQGEESSK